MGRRSIVPDSSKLGVRRAPPPRCADVYDSDIDDENPDPEGPAECYPCSKLFITMNLVFSLRRPRKPYSHELTMDPALILKSGAAKT